MPTVCPVCKDILLNEFRPEINKGQTLIKKCNKRLSHKIMFISHIADYNVVTGLEIQFAKTKAMWVWLPDETLLNFWVEGTSHLNIPVFEPDLSNFAKLTNKIKTYILFS